MDNPNIPTEKERAYFAMLEYLHAYWERGQSAEVGGMLGDMHFVPGGTTMDAACWEDWNHAWKKSEGKAKADYLLKLRK
ncbi:MAG: hypothetical protein QY325_04800 [Flavobacteriales bacterium]|nr:MAG: hypothetical protein QY325_04800 [Flavobacteriales bacterium]